MSLAQLLNTPCTLLLRSPSGEDDYGSETSTVEEVETVCEVQQQRRTEEDDQGELSDTGWLGIFPAGTDLRTGDGVRVEDLGTFELVGDPWPARNPRTQAESHLEATLRKTAGGEDAS